MRSVSGQDYQMMFWGNLASAISFYILASQFFIFARNPTVVKVFYAADDPKDSVKRRIFRLLFATTILITCYISLCGTGHLMIGLAILYPENVAVMEGEVVVTWLLAIVSFLTALVGFPLFPTIAKALQGLELSSDGKVQLAGSYLIEVVDLIKESILVLSEDLVVRKCNDVSKVLFGADIVGSDICQYIHPDDLPLFTDAIGQATESYSFGATTVEVRIEHEASASAASPKFNPQKQAKQSKLHKKSKNYKVYTTEETPFEVNGDIEMGEATPLNADREAQSAHETYIWIEVTVCRGKGARVDGTIEQDIKIVCRNIDDRKKRQAFQALVESTEERGRINESKLRYISCIAHDLKTPLQSFCYSLDLLSETELLPEQRELVGHASVAVDLMKLTISQTMDISKALTGAKLMPRRTTVCLSSVLNRVKIIINGYSKQVPVSFEVASDVCDEIITDEEWLWQMLLNLLTNACKYTDRGSICLRVSVSIDCSGSTKPKTGCFALLNGQSIPPLEIPKGSRDFIYVLMCEVIDTGIGISPDKIGHIFDAFAQVQEGQVTGTGLGLFGVRTRAEGLLGTCGARHNIESSTGTGTVLWFALPYVPNIDTACSTFSGASSPKQSQLSLAKYAFEALQANCPPSPARKITHSPVGVTKKAPNGRSLLVKTALASPHLRSSVTSISQSTGELLIRALKLTAMVVEDTPTVRKLMQKLLLSMGFASVVCYENGSQGLEAMMAAPVDIVFSDVQMPIMTGPEMTRRFRMWEASVAAQTPMDSPTRSTLANASFKNSFFSTDDAVPLPSPKNATSPPLLERRKRQLIVAVTANSAECEKVNDGGFDEICSKPLSRADIYKVIIRHFQYD